MLSARQAVRFAEKVENVGQAGRRGRKIGAELSRTDRRPTAAGLAPPWLPPSTATLFGRGQHSLVSC